jgi:hypothetical protein
VQRTNREPLAGIAALKSRAMRLSALKQEQSSRVPFVISRSNETQEPRERDWEAANFRTSRRQGLARWCFTRSVHCRAESTAPLPNWREQGEDSFLESHSVLRCLAWLTNSPSQHLGFRASQRNPLSRLISMRWLRIWYTALAPMQCSEDYAQSCLNLPFSAAGSLEALCSRALCSGAALTFSRV